MYCKKCYGKLDLSLLLHACPWCDRAFDPADESTYRPRPFPSIGRIAGYVLATTIFSLLVGCVVALFQMAGTSGH
jgi:hypothetical protein